MLLAQRCQGMKETCPVGKLWQTLHIPMQTAEALGTVNHIPASSKVFVLKL